MEIDHVPSSTKKSSMCIGAYSPTHFPVFSQWWKCRLKVGRVPAGISARINSVQEPEHEHRGKWYFVTKIVLTYILWEKIVLFSDREKLLKFEAEGQKFANLFKQWFIVLLL